MIKTLKENYYNLRKNINFSKMIDYKYVTLTSYLFSILFTFIIYILQ